MDQPSSIPSRLAAFLALATIATAAAAQFGAVGLSGVRGQRFANENLIFYFPQEGDRSTAALAIGDFNGDGADDLATGVPGDDNLGGFTPNSGIVVVRYGLPGRGLSPDLADDVLTQAASGSPDPDEDGDAFGSSLAACDLNGDGFGDLAIGIPNEDHLGHADAGAVQVHFGTAGGLAAAGDTFLTQSSPGVPEDSEAEDEFGFALACGDFDDDGFDDLAIGAPSEGFFDGFDEGFITVVHGDAFGLDFSRSYGFSQDSAGMEDGAEDGDFFGSALAAGDFNGDQRSDLAIGVFGESEFSGGVHLMFGSSAGLVATGNRFFSENSLGGASEEGDLFGDALAAGDFDGDGHDDLLIGVPLEDFDGGAIERAGQAIAVYGAAGGLDFGRTQFWLEDFILGPGTTEAGDRFGEALAVGDFDGDGYDDAAIGQPFEHGLVFDDGAASIVMGSASGLTSARVHGLAAGQWGLPGVPNQADRNYGWALASGDFDGDGFADLAIGAPNENEGGVADVGAAVVLYGSLFADGFETADAGFWSGAVP